MTYKNRSFASRPVECESRYYLTCPSLHGRTSIVLADPSSREVLAPDILVEQGADQKDMIRRVTAGMETFKEDLSWIEVHWKHAARPGTSSR